MSKINDSDNIGVSTTPFFNEKTKKLFLLLSLISMMMLFYLFGLNKIYIYETVETYSLLQIPVIIGACVGGPSIGLILCLFYGFADIIYASFSVNYTDILASPFAISNIGPHSIKGNIISLIMCFLPKIFLAVVPGLIFKHLKNNCKNFWQIFLSIICVFAAILCSFSTFIGLFNLVFINCLSDIPDFENFVLMVNSTTTLAFIQKILINLVIDPIAIYAIKNIAHFD